MKSIGLGERLVSVGPFYIKVFCVLNLDTFSVQFRLLVCTFLPCMVQLIIQHVISMAAVILLYLLPYSYSVLRFS
jgi:hypothetical protein